MHFKSELNHQKAEIICSLGCLFRLRALVPKIKAVFCSRLAGAFLLAKPHKNSVFFLSQAIALRRGRKLRFER